MSNKRRDDLNVVELQEKILVRTSIPKENHAALRNGFAGYPANPRWNVSKFHAWKTGCQWREAFLAGKMAVRSSDFFLVSSAEIEKAPETIQSNISPWHKFPFSLKAIVNHYQTV